jgi:hypothetical protein
LKVAIILSINLADEQVKCFIKKHKMRDAEYDASVRMITAEIEEVQFILIAACEYIEAIQELKGD